jgi:hypothetical protein
MRITKTLALAVAGGMFLLAPLYSAGEQASGETKVSGDLSALRLHSLPFSLDQVLNHFNEAFGKRASRIDERTFGYTDRENPDEMVIITVSDLDTGLAIVLLATGDYGVNYMREFFEAPFFLREETEQFYKFLEQGPGVRSITLERFKVQMSISHVGSWIVAAMEFGPAQIYRPELAAGRNSHVELAKAWQTKGRRVRTPLTKWTHRRQHPIEQKL